MNKKCPECNGCLSVVALLNNSTFVWECDFCKVFYNKISGGSFVKVDPINLMKDCTWFFGNLLLGGKENVE